MGHVATTCKYDSDVVKQYVANIEQEIERLLQGDDSLETKSQLERANRCLEHVKTIVEQKGHLQVEANRLVLRSCLPEDLRDFLDTVA